MIFNEIKCHVNTSLGLVGGCIPCIPLLCPRQLGALTFSLAPQWPPTFLILESPLFDRVNHSKSIFITTENHHAGETYMMLTGLLFFPKFSILFSMKISYIHNF